MAKKENINKNKQSVQINQTERELLNILKYTELEKSDILHARAVDLAQEKKEEKNDTDSMEIIEFKLAHETYGIESRWIQEVFELRDYTPVPCTPNFILGITNIRGQLISIIDIKEFFGLPAKGITDLNRVIVLKNNDMRLGLLADSVDDIRIINEQSLQSSLPTLQGVRSEYLKGIAENRLIVLDAIKILNDSNMNIYEEVD